MKDGYEDLWKNPQYILKFDPLPQDPKDMNMLYIVLSKMIVNENFKDED